MIHVSLCPSLRCVSGPIRCVVCLPDQDKLVLGWSSNSLLLINNASVYDCATRSVERSFSIGTGRLLKFAALGGNLVAVASSNPGYLRVLCTERGEQSRVMLGRPLGALAAISGAQLAVGDGNDVVLFEHARGSNLAEIRRWGRHQSGVVSVAVLGSSGIIVSMEESGVLQWWDTRGRSLLGSIKYRNVTARAETTQLMSNSAGHVACALPNHTVRVFRLVERGRVEVVRSFGLGTLRTALRFCSLSADGDIVFLYCQTAGRSFVESRVGSATGRSLSRCQVSFEVADTALLGDGQVAVCGYNPGQTDSGYLSLANLENARSILVAQSRFESNVFTQHRLLARRNALVNSGQREQSVNQTSEAPALLLDDAEREVGARRESRQDELALPDCVVCMDSTIEAALTPCGHAKFCLSCANTILSRGETCPICRRECRAALRLYF